MLEHSNKENSMEMNYFKSFDNADIFYRSWNFDKSKKTLVVIHRGHEHSERLNDFASNEKFKKYNIFSYDLRGHGCTKEKSSPVFMDYVRDLNSFVSFIKKEYKISEKDIFVVANSIGGVILTAWVHDYAPEIAGMALLAPAFEIKLYVPLAKESIIFLTKLNKNAKVPSYVKSRVLTHDENEQKKYDSDRLITKDINARLLVDLLDAGKRLADDSAAIDIPTIIFSAGKDYVVKNNSQKKFYLELGNELKEFVYLKDFYHGIMFEEKREEVYKKIDDFIIKSYSLKKESINILPEKFSQKENGFPSHLHNLALPFSLISLFHYILAFDLLKFLKQVLSQCQRRTLYLHSGPEGGKIEMLQHNNNVCITFSLGHKLVYQHKQVACSYSMRSESAMCRGKVEFIEDMEEKRRALDIIMRHYTKDQFSYSDPAVRNVKVWKVPVDQMTGKVFGLRADEKP